MVTVGMEYSSPSMASLILLRALSIASWGEGPSSRKNSTSLEIVREQDVASDPYVDTQDPSVINALGTNEIRRDKAAYNGPC